MSARKKDAEPNEGRAGQQGNAVSYEQLLEQVERKLEALEGGELALEQSLLAYEEGVKALRACHALLQAAEGKIQVLAEKKEEPVLADFPLSEEESSTPSAAPSTGRKRNDAKPEAKDERNSLF